MAAVATEKLDRGEVEALVREVLRQKLAGATPPPARERHAVEPRRAGGPPHPLVVNVSARHMHVKPEHLEILFGPGRQADGTTNLVGALRRAMATTGYSDVKEFQRVEVVVSPYLGQ